MKRCSIVALTVTLLLTVLTSCLNWPETDGSSKQPDRVLFDRAVDAAQRKKFDVARLTLQTLINAYPDSEYAPKATAVLKGLPNCGESASPECE